MGGNATSRLHSRGSPKQRGTKSELGTTPLPSREPKKGRKRYVTLAFWGSLAKGTKSKVAELGARTKLWMCSPKEYHQKIRGDFRRNGVSALKNTLKTPPQSIFVKKRGVFQNPPRYRISQKPPPCPQTAGVVHAQSAPMQSTQPTDHSTSTDVHGLGPEGRGGGSLS